MHISTLAKGAIAVFLMTLLYMPFGQAETSGDGAKGSIQTVFVSAGNISTSTETPAEDYLIPDSQVFITGQGRPSALGGLGGLIGGMIAVEVSRANNAGMAIDAAESLKMRFDSTLKEALRKAIANEKTPINFRVEDNEPADLVLLPYARLISGSDKSVAAAFQVNLRNTKGGTNRPARMKYVFSSVETHPFMDGSSGWADQKSEPVRKAAEKAFDALARVVLADMSGAGFSVPAADKRKMIRWKAAGTNGVKGILLAEFPDYLVIAPAPKDWPIPGIISVVDRALVIE
jgi:hypothetical protein